MTNSTRVAHSERFVIWVVVLKKYIADFSFSPKTISVSVFLEDAMLFDSAVKAQLAVRDFKGYQYQISRVYLRRVRALTPEIVIERGNIADAIIDDYHQEGKWVDGEIDDFEKT